MPAESRKRNSKRGVMNPNLAPFAFKPGQSGNPLGRRKNDNLAEHIREETKGGKELCDYVLTRFRAEIPPEADGRLEMALREEKLEAATWLADRGFSKPKPIEDDTNPGQLGMTLVQVLVSLGPDVVREVNKRLIAASGDVVDAEPNEK